MLLGRLALTLASLMLASCLHLSSVAVTPVPAVRNNVVKASVEKFVVLAFNFDNNFVDGLTDQLASKCEGGVVSGILTKHYTISYILAYKMVVEAQGFCNRKA